MARLTNSHGIPLALALWAVDDDYDYNDDPSYISATSLLKPLREITLRPRVPFELKKVEDVADYLARAMGNSIHAGVEIAWTHRYVRNLRKLGYDEDTIAMVQINPPKPIPGTIPVYIEQRATRQVGKWTIGGKFDLCIEGVLHDTKTTSTFKYRKGDTKDYMLQGSIYRWLHRDKITSDVIRICFVFTDWQAFRAKQDPDYPQTKVLSIDVPLMSIEETETWILQRLSLIEQFSGVPERQLPACTPEELWVEPTQYKYYSDPMKTERATKDFKTDKAGAYAYLASKGKGIVKEIVGTPKRCGYCSAFPICTQRTT